VAVLGYAYDGWMTRHELRSIGTSKTSWSAWSCNHSLRKQVYYYDEVTWQQEKTGAYIESGSDGAVGSGRSWPVCGYMGGTGWRGRGFSLSQGLFVRTGRSKSRHFLVDARWRGRLLACLLYFASRPATLLLYCHFPSSRIGNFKSTQVASCIHSSSSCLLH
jgi:hypothetical protein